MGYLATACLTSHCIIVTLYSFFALQHSYSSIVHSHYVKEWFVFAGVHAHVP